VTAVAYAAPSSIYWALAYTVATIYAYTWDVKMDWGLSYRSRTFSRIRPGEEQSSSPDLLQMYPSRRYFYFTILDLLGRSTWALSTLTPGSSGDPSFEAFIFVLSALEIFRRAFWATLRVEHEHVANPSKYRTMGYVPRLAPVKTQTEKRRSTVVKDVDGHEVDKGEAAGTDEPSGGEFIVDVDPQAVVPEKANVVPEKVNKEKKDKKDKKDKKEKKDKEDKGDNVVASAPPVLRPTEPVTIGSALEEPLLRGFDPQREVVEGDGQEPVIACR